MVKVCNHLEYPPEKEEQYKSFFEKYAYPLHTFQKHAMEAVIEDHHVLVTAHTGSGKTLCGEFAIEYFLRLNKKVIYTTPLKALSNQKFYDFTQKYPHISFGILTGDLKTNPDADVLIMTAEILLNKLYSVFDQTGKTPSVQFEMDIQNELGCVVMDEVHFINDASRGHVWEQTIMMLPPHISLVMLSATIDNQQRFAGWCEQKGTNHPSFVSPLTGKKKEVYIASNFKRSVPLTHYGFITVNQAIFKAVKDKAQQEDIRKIINQPFLIQNAQNAFQECPVVKMNKMLHLFQSKQVFVKRAHVLNQVTKHLFDHNMLPALCFVFSRKQLELCAREVTTTLLEDDSKVPYIIRRECEHIMRKLPNFQEYMQLPEYLALTQLLEKGVAIHHAGMLAPLREMVELLYAKGFIKLLFATETMSTGINMPVKTVLFTSLQKYDGGNVPRYLLAHEYTQAAGRAGRLGIDTVGHVIHLNNLFKEPVDSVTYKGIMSGKPQKLMSKFKISYNLLLNLIGIGETDCLTFLKRSMVELEIMSEVKEWQQKKASLQQQVDVLVQRITTPSDVLADCFLRDESLHSAPPKHKKEQQQKRDTLFLEMENKYPHFHHDFTLFKQCNERKTECHQVDLSLQDAEMYLERQMQVLLEYLEQQTYIEKSPESHCYGLTYKGKMASLLKEVHGIVFAQLLEEGTLLTLDTKQLVTLFGCFTNIVVPDDKKALAPQSGESLVDDLLWQIKRLFDETLLFENERRLDCGVEYQYHYDLLPYLHRWCDCHNSQECALLLKRMEEEKCIFLGEFVKALLKINNIAVEMEKIAELYGHIAFLSHLKLIGVCTLKYVATNQSLYV